MTTDEYNFYNILVQTGSMISGFCIAIAGAAIAFMQYRIAKNKQRDELFDRRIKIYRAAVEYLHHLQHDGTTNEVHLTNFISTASLGRFLFEHQVNNLIQEIILLGTAKVAGHSNLDNVTTAKIFKDLSERVDREFSSYLTIKGR